MKIYRFLSLSISSLKNQKMSGNVAIQIKWKKWAIMPNISLKLSTHGTVLR